MFIKEDNFDTEKDYQDVVDSDFEDEFMTSIELIEDELNNGQYLDNL